MNAENIPTDKTEEPQFLTPLCVPANLLNSWRGVSPRQRTKIGRRKRKGVKSSYLFLYKMHETFLLQPGPAILPAEIR